MALTESGSAALLNTLAGKNSVFSNAYLGLCTSVTGSTFTEPSGNGYARVHIGSYSSGFDNLIGTPSGGAVANVKEIHFPKTTGSWGTITHFALYTSSSGGTPYAYGQLTSSVAVTSSDMVAMFEVGDFTMSIA